MEMIKMTIKMYKMWHLNVCAVLQEKLDDGQPVVSGGKVKRGRMPAVQIATVDELRRRVDSEDAADVIQITGFGSFE